MPRRERAAVLPLSWTFPRNPLDSRWRIQSLQQPQLGAFHTSTVTGAAASGTAMAASAAEINARRPGFMTRSP